MPDRVSLVKVKMGGRPCAIPCEQVVEIVPPVDLDQIPAAPPEVLGVMNLRGAVVPVMDVRARVSAGSRPGLGYQHLVVVTAGQRQVGLAVDEVEDVVEVSRSSIERPADLTGTKGPGVVRIDHELVLVIAPEDVVRA